MLHDALGFTRFACRMRGEYCIPGEPSRNCRLKAAQLKGIQKVITLMAFAFSMNVIWETPLSGSTRAGSR